MHSAHSPRWSSASPKARVLLAVYFVAFIVGALSHAIDFYGEFPPYGQYPVPLQIFWSSLLPIDIALAVMIFVATRPVLLFAPLLMLADVIANTYATYNFWHTTFARNPGLWFQVAYFIYAVVASPLLWRGMKPFGWAWRYEPISHRVPSTLPR